MPKAAVPIEEAVNIFYARQYAYDILRRFFLEEPASDYLKIFTQKNIIRLFPFQEESEGIREGISDIQAYLGKHDVVNIDSHYEELHWDYTRMFIGPFELVAPPWESSYVRKDKLLFQGTTMNVRSLYEEYGMEVKDFNIEADDHVGLELDFMYSLNDLCIRLAEAGDFENVNLLNKLIKDQQLFLENHLLKFVPQFSKLVEKGANTQFFIGLAKILRNYLQLDLQVLNEFSNMEILHEGGKKQ